MNHFLSPAMAASDTAATTKQTLAARLLGLFGGSAEPAEHDIRVYSPIGEIDDFDEDEAERRREYISSTEESAQRLAAAMSATHAQDEALAKCIVSVTLAVARACQPDALLPGADIPNGGGAPGGSGANACEASGCGTAHRRLSVSLALLQSSAEAHYWSTKELATWKEFNLVDVVAEYYAMVGGVKGAINHGTEMLMRHERALLRHQAQIRRANGLRVQYPSDTPSVRRANEQEAQAEREMEAARQEYADANNLVRRELVRFVRERTSGVCKALESMAAVELDTARARGEELRAICGRLQAPADEGMAAELTADAEMEAELVCSGVLAARRLARKRSAPSCHVSSTLVSPDAQPHPPVLPAFLHRAPASAPTGRLRYASSCTGLSAIPQPVSPSEYLQYSRQTLHSSLVRTSSSALSSGHPGGGTKTPPQPHAGRRDRDAKGKQPAFAA
ncbi:hypothetical protein LPJ61_003210 [Coemansia biformis]|uniref:Sorting nexin/Vps5-like C-terminal domain-containing protein n=1 Tax=Coemansia biformis TaxID=1286918 RepID=A0A9W7YDH0_9FUNG|nr:hypothetical protein LPJ61_003210 [Coemansia biformis]